MVSGVPVYGHNPNFADYARLCGAEGHRVDRADDLAPALTAALQYTGPSRSWWIPS